MRRSWWAGVGVALAVAGLAGCGEPPPPRNCGVVVDTTRYARYEIAKEMLQQRVVPFARGCTWAAFAAITGGSESTSCRRPSLHLVATEQENPNGNPRVAEEIREGRIGEVAKHALWLLEECEDRGRNSDVIGGLRVIAGNLGAAPDRGAPSEIIVFSDLMNNVGELRLQRGDYASPAAREAKVRSLREKNLLPVLRGRPKITVYGFNLLSEKDPDLVPQLEQMWLAIFAASGAGEVNLL